MEKEKVLHPASSTNHIPSTTDLSVISTMITSVIGEASMIPNSAPSSTGTPYTTSTKSSTVFAIFSFGDTTSSYPAMIDKEVSSEDLNFSVFDYVIFFSMLLISTIIGVYFGFLSKVKQDNTKEYLLGGKAMSKFPISASLIATHVSGITLLGLPTELYGHGSQYWLCVIAAFPVYILMRKIYLPVFYDLQVTSVFTYLENRFDHKVRSAASFIYAFACIIYIPIVVYVPALAFSQVTGINLHLITPLICIVCTFYTTVGGLRAVVWTDTLQFIMMIGATLAIISLGLVSVGGFTHVWEAAEQGGRLVFFNMNPDPFIRSSFWTVTLGLSTIWIGTLGVSQGCIQRFLAVPDLKIAKKTLIIFTGGMIFIKSCSCFMGLLMYAKYEACDPYSIGKINKLDQILPYYVMDVGAKIPGLPGFFVSGIFSAALSTLSSVLNTLAGTIYEDFIRHHFPNSSEKNASKVMKALVVILGIIVIALVFVAEKMGEVMHMAISLSGVTSGTLLGLFSSGMLTSTINTKGAIYGAVMSMIATGSILIGAQLYPQHPFMPFRTDGCDVNLLHNATLVSTPLATVQNDVPRIFKLSFMYYSLFGVVVYFMVAYTVSIMTGRTEIKDQRLLAPFMRDLKQYEKEEALRKQNIHFTETTLMLKELETGSNKM
ncbi:sodium-coupled monocarboxylate transporter 1-like isoform X1 [Armigeres subalbatus]|uniref:sodium-coupled monocarboxylate transporter 1-like isoform X1 n=1 Tax=Armigeres subalbatus TaxID=124917 RepID=UPI002ED0E5A2